MAFHLSECLYKFGPVRAWWSFPFERLIGKILKACQNNHIGELEITFFKSFSHGGNLRSLLRSNNFPQELDPFLDELNSLHKDWAQSGETSGQEGH
ncbi:hypothetical protein CROQUDRAFT_219116 [Cronartium quercuum f. sp. fusiforme G11]|uniref:Uncharacterized protein n=1 Tax=Cronartium quercuum f. sp. fusiforme G11 TaxID=708437 RepID=A0A9P6NBV7_9BASI|nr:hypothetical protein CROQUDRAFT_219116 [Cronartium quercuum f. sp. fusiforme G11]